MLNKENGDGVAMDEGRGSWTAWLVCAGRVTWSVAGATESNVELGCLPAVRQYMDDEAVDAATVVGGDEDAAAATAAVM